MRKQKASQSRRLTLETSTIARLAPAQLERVSGGLPSGAVCTTRVVEDPIGP